MTRPPLTITVCVLMLALLVASGSNTLAANSAKPPIIPVEGQPLAANVGRLLEALKYLGAPLPEKTAQALQAAIEARDGKRVQELFDPHVLFVVTTDAGGVK